MPEELVGNMREINLLYSPKIYWVKILGSPDEYPYGDHKFYSSFDLKKFLDKVDLSKYRFIAGVD